jgi:heme/copper-type cytochrome/quinol oxidase subunit 3
MQIHAGSQKSINWNLFTGMLMLVLTMGTIAYAVIRSGMMEDRYGKHNNITAYISVPEEFIVTVILLVAPLIGICSAFRMTKSNQGAKKIGWILIVLFSTFFVQNALIEWELYNHYESILHR